MHNVGFYTMEDFCITTTKTILLAWKMRSKVVGFPECWLCVELLGTPHKYLACSEVHSGCDQG